MPYRFIPNFLSFLRILFSLFFIFFMLSDSRIAALITFFICSISDILDGYFARLSNCVTDFGKIIDPIADKTCFMVVLIYLIDQYQGANYILNPFLLFYIFLVLRDIIIISFSLVCKHLFF